MNCKDTVYYLRARGWGLRLLTDFNMLLSVEPKRIMRHNFVLPPSGATERPSCKTSGKLSPPKRSKGLRRKLGAKILGS
jgi:hypothetical protein